MKKVHKSQLNESIPSKIDIFLCSSSFEERCFSATNAIDRNRIKSSLVFYNHDQQDEITTNAQKLKNILPNSSLIKIHSDDPVYTLNQIYKSINIDKDKKTTIIFDTTTFTHEGLLILYKVLSLKKSEKTEIILIYNGAKEYSTNVQEIEKKWLTKGVGNLRTIMGYSGFINPSLKTLLIVLFGFEVERTLKVIDIFEADFVSIGVAADTYSINDDHYKINKMRHKDLKTLLPQISNFYISLINPLDTSTQILEEIAKYDNYNIVIAPMSNKFSTIGAAIAAEKNDNIQICYIPANIYNREGYSNPSEDFYISEI